MCDNMSRCILWHRSSAVRSGLQGTWGRDQPKQAADCRGGVLQIAAIRSLWCVIVFEHFGVHEFVPLHLIHPTAIPKPAQHVQLYVRSGQVWMDEFQSLVKFASGPLRDPLEVLAKCDISIQFYTTLWQTTQAFVISSEQLWLWDGETRMIDKIIWIGPRVARVIP